jgi:hypothetical protein
LRTLGLIILKAKFKLHARGKLPVDLRDFDFSCDIPGLGDTTAELINDQFVKLDVNGGTYGGNTLGAESSYTPLYPFP